jgi:hypothetical protein
MLASSLDAARTLVCDAPNATAKMQAVTATVNLLISLLS